MTHCIVILNEVKNLLKADHSLRGKCVVSEEMLRVAQHDNAAIKSIPHLQLKKKAAALEQQPLHTA